VYTHTHPNPKMNYALKDGLGVSGTVISVLGMDSGSVVIARSRTPPFSPPQFRMCACVRVCVHVRKYGYVSVCVCMDETVLDGDEFKYICTGVRHLGRELGRGVGMLNIDRCRRRRCPFIARVRRDRWDNNNDE